MNKLITLFAVVFLAAVTFAGRIELRGPNKSSPLTKLNKYNIAQDSVSVSGVSAGGFFAVQFQVAYSKSLVGAGIFAAGPYYCAQGSLMTAEEQCMAGFANVDLNTIQSTITQYQSQGLIDSTSNLARHKVFLYSGTFDYTVKQSVVQQLATQYQQLGIPQKNIVTNFTVASGHAWITNNYGSLCYLTMTPYINNCNLDGAYQVLNTIYGYIKPKKEAIAANLITFEQTGNFSANYMTGNGYVYVPSSCQRGVSCRLHVVFHGCEQGASILGTTFVENIGMNEYAESNNIIMVYPQVTTGLLNEAGCFDWINFSYTDSNYANKQGGQMKAVANILAALGAKVY
ncbi:fibronectin, type-like protein [Naegleria gruberi]|uniref:Fibronectin, type-like protein n=1 Tax=Naegleria gruberi TaxID=5762 RepID=D2W1K0_NAEGR|nr:fibronectin, type-like protein [Naegleria gruberi]EFC37059.1 fibronectin, type-like protein [Naegleria gruberi]|eukprot:XP_002669803.1 fibronectin, type-like protein [Naegleria gruberi strain NEG-M]